MVIPRYKNFFESVTHFVLNCIGAIKSMQLTTAKVLTPNSEGYRISPEVLPPSFILPSEWCIRTTLYLSLHLSLHRSLYTFHPPIIRQHRMIEQSSEEYRNLKFPQGTLSPPGHRLCDTCLVVVINITSYASSLSLRTFQSY
jgi:hypothetical protein